MQIACTPPLHCGTAGRVWLNQSAWIGTELLWAGTDSIAVRRHRASCTPRRSTAAQRSAVQRRHSTAHLQEEGAVVTGQLVSAVPGYHCTAKNIVKRAPGAWRKPLPGRAAAANACCAAACSCSPAHASRRSQRCPQPQTVFLAAAAVANPATSWSRSSTSHT